MTNPPEGDRSAGPRARRIAAPTMIVLSALCAFVAVFALWAERQAIQAGGWSTTAEALTTDPVVQDALAQYLVDELYANVDVSAVVQDALPEQFDALALPAAGALRQVVERAADEALGRPRVQRALQVALVEAHELAVRLLREEGTAVEIGGGTVVLNLQAVLAEVIERTGVGGRVAGALPPDAGRVEIVRSDQLASAQDTLRLLDRLAILMPLLSLGLLAGAVWAAEGRRRETLRLAGIAFAVAALLVPIARSLAGDIVIDAVNPAPANLAAAEQVWLTATSYLRDGGVALLTYAVLILAGTTLAGPTGAARSARRGLRRVSDPHIAYPLAGALALVVLWWGPTEGLRRPLTAVILLALLAVGLETLRRQIVREALAEGAPRAPGLDLGAVASSVGGRISGALRRRDRHEDRLAELERAQRLRDAGTLSEAEFDAEKRRILGD